MFSKFCGLFKVLPILISFTSVGSSALANDAVAGGAHDFERSRQIIDNGLNVSPSARHDSRVTFSEGLRKEEVVDWASSREIDVLSLAGTLNVGNRKISVFLGDLASFDAPLAEIIKSQIHNYHETAINDIINDLEGARQSGRVSDKSEVLGRQIAELKKSLNEEILWHSATVITSYAELYDLSTSRGLVREVDVREKNNADLFDEHWNQRGVQKRSIHEIKPHVDRNLPGSLNASPDNSSAATSSSGLRRVKNFSRSLAQTALEVVVPFAHAAGTLCGNKPGETFCPPDSNFVPDNPVWYVSVSQPYVEYTDYLQGVSHTLVDWSSTGIRSFRDSSAPHCRPVVSGTSANCRTLIGTLQEDVIYVPDSTYEAETEVPNPSCAFRTGNRTIDFWAGCFSAYYALSNFPNAYVDTTFYDDFDTYSATLGSYAGASLSASQTYYNYIYFDARGETLPPLVYETVKTRGQIGTRIPSTCYGPFCVYGVDTSITIDSAKLIPLL